LSIATFVVVWLVVSPAQAMAPLCDPRGAVGFAPPPQFQDEERSLDIPPDCVEVNPLETKNYLPGRPAALDLSSSQEPVAASTSVLPSFVFSERLPVRIEVEARPPPGVHDSIERPPRV
jgi:hypothetical protein